MSLEQEEILASLSPGEKAMFEVGYAIAKAVRAAVRAGAPEPVIRGIVDDAIKGQHAANVSAVCPALKTTTTMAGKSEEVKAGT